MAWHDVLPMKQHRTRQEVEVLREKGWCTRMALHLVHPLFMLSFITGIPGFQCYFFSKFAGVFSGLTISGNIDQIRCLFSYGTLKFGFYPGSQISFLSVFRQLHLRPKHSKSLA